MKRAVKIFAFVILGLFLINMIGVVSAANVLPGRWYSDVIGFLGFGETWEQVFVAIFISLIIAAATYDILSLTAFENTTVKILIGVGLAGIVAVTGAIRAIAGLAFSLAGGIAAISIAGVIILGAVAFFLIHVGVTWLAVKMIKAKGEVETEKAGQRAARRARAIAETGEELSSHGGF